MNVFVEQPLASAGSAKNDIRTKLFVSSPGLWKPPGSWLSAAAGQEDQDPVPREERADGAAADRAEHEPGVGGGLNACPWASTGLYFHFSHGNCCGHPICFRYHTMVAE